MRVLVITSTLCLAAVPLLVQAAIEAGLKGDDIIITSGHSRELSDTSDIPFPIMAPEDYDPQVLFTVEALPRLLKTVKPSREDHRRSVRQLDSTYG